MTDFWLIVVLLGGWWAASCMVLEYVRGRQAQDRYLLRVARAHRRFQR